MSTGGDLRLGGNFDSNLQSGGYAVTSSFFPGNLNRHNFAEEPFHSLPLYSPGEVEFAFETPAQSRGSRDLIQIFLSWKSDHPPLREHLLTSRDHTQIFLSGSSRSAEWSEEVLKRWEGVVETVDETDGVFTARLYDLTNDEPYPSEIAELLIDDVSDDDRSLLQAGAVFYLTVGYSERVSGRKDRFVRVEFRRLPNWTESDLRRAGDRARRITRFLDSES